MLCRQQRLDRILQQRRPDRAHHRLTHLAVRAGRRGHGVGSHLLLYHHAYLHTAGIPADLEALGPRSQDMFGRHGYTGIGPPLLIPGTRHPDLAHVAPTPPAGHHPPPAPTAFPAVNPDHRHLLREAPL